MDGEIWLKEYVEGIRSDLHDHRKESRECFRVMTERLADLKSFEVEVRRDTRWVSFVVSTGISLSLLLIGIVAKRYGVAP